MDTSTVVNIILCILSFILAAISVITVVITIRQNNRMIKNSTRPYVVMTMGTTNFQNLTTYLILKNYGSTGANIKKITFDIDIKDYSLHPDYIPFSHAEGMLLAPGQKIITPVNAEKLHNDGIKTFTVSIVYSDGENSYNEPSVINYEGYADNVYLRASTENKELKIISYASQDMVEKQI